MNVLVFLLVVGVNALSLSPRKVEYLPFHADKTQLHNKLKLVVDDAGVLFSFQEVANGTDGIRHGLNKIQRVKNLPSLVALVNDLESSILALPDTDPRGPAFKAVVNKASEIRDVLSTVFNDVQRIPYDAENLNLFLLGKNDQTDQIRKNLNSLNINLSNLVKKLNAFYSAAAEKRVSIEVEVQELVDLLGQLSVSQQQYDAAIKKVGDKLRNRITIKPPKISTIKQHNISTIIPPKIITAKPPKISTAKPPKISTIKQHKISTIIPPKIITAKPPKISTAKPPKISTIKQHKISTIIPPKIITAKPPKISTAKPPKISTIKQHKISTITPPKIITAKPPKISTVKPPKIITRK